MAIEPVTVQGTDQLATALGIQDTAFVAIVDNVFLVKLPARTLDTPGRLYVFLIT